MIAAIFGGSNIQVSGPTGAMVVVLGPVIATKGIGALAAVTVLAGVIMVAAGVLKLGRVVTLLPWPVIEGFTLGIAMIIFLQQDPRRVRRQSRTKQQRRRIGRTGPRHTVPGSRLCPAGTGGPGRRHHDRCPRIHPQIPGSLIAIIVASIAAQVLDLPVARIGSLPDSLPAPALPSLDWAP